MAHDESKEKEEAELAAAKAKAEEAEADEWSEDRAKKTILNQRKVEKEQAKEIASLRKFKEAADAEATAKAEADKGLEEKLAEAKAELAAVKETQAEADVKADFLRVATLRGYEDPDIAYLAAKDADVLGTPKDGIVGDHDFDVLEERYPKLASEAGDKRGFGSGDAGRTGNRKPGKSPADQFNDAVRRQMNH